MKTLLKIAAVAVVLFAVGAWALYRPSQVTGEEFKGLVHNANQTSASAWYLYESAGNNLCFRHVRRFVDKRYCVSKDELDVIGKWTPPYEPRAMGTGEFILKKDAKSGEKNVAF
ncbi:hypothetical protein [Lysobacter sp. Root690]|uniref:hypothetical protein n=1 Tax=Lysobacter sp. Root690 TaxID=1736588 RepID=UPI0012F894AA|nr:hypothetical protein [Lysobacter sp. Root690]